MRKFKAKKGRYQRTYEITEENVKEHLVPREKYVYKERKNEALIAICPICENAIRLVGIYSEIKKHVNGKDVVVRPFGKHIVNRTTQFGDFDGYAYERCPLSSKYQEKGLRDGEYYIKPTQINFDTYNAIRENFDSAMYVLAHSIGIQYIRTKDAERILKNYLGLNGYMHKYSAVYNIPWMLLSESSQSIRLWGLRVLSDTPLYEHLKTRKDIKLVSEETRSGTVYRVEGNGAFLTDAIEFGVHKRKVNKDEELVETIEMRMYQINNDKATIVWHTNLDISLDWFVNLINKQDRYRNTELIAVAEKLMQQLD